MDLHIATVSQLVSTAVSTAKTVRDLAKDSSDSTLKASISDLYDALIDIKSKVVDLDEENRSLKAQLTAKNDIEGPTSPHGYFHHKSEPDKPLCPRCLQSKDERPVYLTEVRNVAGGQGRRCIVCNFTHVEIRNQLNQHSMQRRPYSWS